MAMEEVILKKKMRDWLQMNDISPRYKVQFYLFSEYDLPTKDTMVMKMLQRHGYSRQSCKPEMLSDAIKFVRYEL